MIAEYQELLKLSDAADVIDVGISKEEFVNWIGNPVTEKIMKVIFHNRMQVANSIVLGDTIDNNEFVSLKDTAKAIGIVAGFDFLLSLTYEDDEQDEGAEDETDTT